MAPSATDPPRYNVRLAELGGDEQICAVCREGYMATSKHLLSAPTIHRQVQLYYNPARVRQEIGSAGESPAWQGYVVAVTDDGKLIGAAGGGVLDETIGQVYVLYLRMRLRRAGIGTALLEFLTQQQAATGATEQWVSVTEGNDLGIPFYLAKGFVHRDRQPYVEDAAGNIEAYSLRMARPI